MRDTAASSSGPARLLFTWLGPGVSAGVVMHLGGGGRGRGLLCCWLGPGQCAGKGGGRGGPAVGQWRREWSESSGFEPEVSAGVVQLGMRGA